MEVNTASLTISVTAGDKEELKRQMAERGIRCRSKMFRDMLWGGDGSSPNHNTADPASPTSVTGEEQARDGTMVATALRDAIAKMADMHAAAEDGYPSMGLAAYELAMVVARNHMGDIATGTLPMVGDDARAAGMDPHGRQAWELYTETLPGFFRVLLGLDRPPEPDVRYEPLDSVDGQHAGAVRGEVVSCRQVYPDGNTIKYVKLEVRTAARETVPVLVPASMVLEEMGAGMTVYAAGVFAVMRQKVVMRACKCAGVRIDGYGPIYELTGEWGLSGAAANAVINMLQESHGSMAPDFAPAFAEFARMDRSVRGWDLAVEGPGGKRMYLDSRDLRRNQPGADAIRECIGLWGRVVHHAKVAGIVISG